MAVAVIALSLMPRIATAACLNKFVSRTDGPKLIVTLLTGKLTFGEAQALSHSITAGRAPRLEWVDGRKTIARQFGDLKVVRPMPVACDDKPSGVVMVITFISRSQPSKKLDIRFDPNTIISFDVQ
jgi:hypothetical protein